MKKKKKKEYRNIFKGIKIIRIMLLRRVLVKQEQKHQSNL